MAQDAARTFTKVKDLPLPWTRIDALLTEALEWPVAERVARLTAASPQGQRKP